MIRLFALAAASTFAFTGPAGADEIFGGGKLLLTRGVTAVEGGSGAALSTWALIAGNGTEETSGATAFASRIPLADYDFTAYGAAIGLKDRLELSFARHVFDTGATGAKLGLGEGFQFGQDIWGLKVRLLGDAVYDQDRWLPQVAVGLQHKIASESALVSALGAEAERSSELYVAATKLFLAHSLLLNATLRYTDANQFGLLGFGGDAENDPCLCFEGAAALMLSERLLIGAEYRQKPDNLSFAEEDDGFDAFAAYALTPNLSLVGGYADLGAIATFENQRGAYLSLQLGF